MFVACGMQLYLLRQGSQEDAAMIDVHSEADRMSLSICASRKAWPLTKLVTPIFAQPWCFAQIAAACTCGGQHSIRINDQYRVCFTKGSRL